MQFHGGGKGGWLEVANLKLLASFCAGLALALVLFLFLDLASGPCGQQIGLSLYSGESDLPKITESLKARLAERNASGITCPACPAVEKTGEVCVKEWEQPLVVKERESEKYSDENTPEVQRKFTPVGVSAFLFVLFSAYRLGPNHFSVVGLSPKPLQDYGNPGYECFWIPASGDLSAVEGKVTGPYLPQAGYAKQYVATVIHCHFDHDVGTNGTGGSVKIVLKMGSKDMTGLPGTEFVALTEKPGEYDGSLFTEPLKYDFMYCGGPLYGQVSPQRVREWIAWHARMFGPRSQFILWDAGGLNEDVRKILSPWVKLGMVTIMNYRQEARYDSHYHSQSVMLNDCLMQAKREAEWAFFFDIDEYLYVVPNRTLIEVLTEINQEMGRKAQEVSIWQRLMNPNHCVKRPENDTDERLWGLEKLVYKTTENNGWGGFGDHKYIAQTKYTLVAGNHDHQVALMPEGATEKWQVQFYDWKDRVHYHHFHNTIGQREELCKEFVDPSLKEMKFNNVTHVYDDSLSKQVDAVKQFELETVGSQPFIT
ncbi:unnamed protein product [Calypogeia fissa]